MPPITAYLTAPLFDWNSEQLWKHAYDGLADDYFFFAQDLLGTQFGIAEGKAIVRWDPETAQATEIGDSLEAWAQWIFTDIEQHAKATLAKAWWKEKGMLKLDQRLMPLQPFALGGKADFNNLIAKDCVEAMLLRAPIATQNHPPTRETIKLPAN